MLGFHAIRTLNVTYTIASKQDHSFGLSATTLSFLENEIQ